VRGLILPSTGNTGPVTEVSAGVVCSDAVAATSVAVPLSKDGKRGDSRQFAGSFTLLRYHCSGSCCWREWHDACRSRTLDRRFGRREGFRR
jgi:hypothetical protein